MYAGQWMRCQSSDRIRTPKWGQNLMARSMDTTIQRMGTGATPRNSSLSVENCLFPSKKIPCQQEIRSCICTCQRHCLAISSSRIWAACCLEKSSRLLLLTSRLRRARSSLRLARWNSSLSACSGPWAWSGPICRLSRSSVTIWDLDLQYSVQMWSLSRASIAWRISRNESGAQMSVTSGLRN